MATEDPDEHRKRLQAYMDRLANERHDWALVERGSLRMMIAHTRKPGSRSCILEDTGFLEAVEQALVHSVSAGEPYEVWQVDLEAFNSTINKDAPSPLPYPLPDAMARDLGFLSMWAMVSVPRTSPATFRKRGSLD